MGGTTGAAEARAEEAAEEAVAEALSGPQGQLATALVAADDPGPQIRTQLKPMLRQRCKQL